MKKCITCQVEKDEESFSIRNKKYRCSECKSCASQRSRKWYADNRERSISRRKEWYKLHKEHSLQKYKERYISNKENLRQRANELNRSDERREKSRERSKKWAKENREKINERARNYIKKNPEKVKARQHVLWAIKLNVLHKPESCSKCKKNTRVEAHHHDYSKPLDVVWVCKICHEELHRYLDDCRTTS